MQSLIDSVLDSSAELLPFFLDYGSIAGPQAEDKKTFISASHQNLIINEAFNYINLYLTSKNISDVSLELIQESVKHSARELSAKYYFSWREVDEAISEIEGLLIGQGPLQKSFDNPKVTDIFISSYDSIKTIENGSLRKTKTSFRSNEQFLRFWKRFIPVESIEDNEHIQRVLPALNSCRLEAFKLNGQLNIILRIPRFKTPNLTELIKTRTLSPKTALWLADIVHYRAADLIVIGAPRSGKTTLIKSLISSLTTVEDTLLIEDPFEIKEDYPAIFALSKLGELGFNLHTIKRSAPSRIIFHDLDSEKDLLLLYKSQEIGFKGMIGSMTVSEVNFLLDKVTKYYSNSTNPLLIIKVGLVKSKPCLLEISELNQTKLIPIISFGGEEQGKRYWEFFDEDSICLNYLKKQGRVLTESNDLRKAQIKR